MYIVHIWHTHQNLWQLVIRRCFCRVFSANIADIILLKKTSAFGMYSSSHEATKCEWPQTHNKQYFDKTFLRFVFLTMDFAWNFYWGILGSSGKRWAEAVRSNMSGMSNLTHLYLSLKPQRKGFSSGLRSPLGISLSSRVVNLNCKSISCFRYWVRGPTGKSEGNLLVHGFVILTLYLYHMFPIFSKGFVIWTI